MINTAKIINSQYALQATNPELAKAQNIVKLCNSGSNLVTQNQCKVAQDVINDFNNRGATPINASKSSWYDIVSKLSQAIIDGINSLIASFFMFIIVAIKMIIFGITKIWLKILYVTGPLALAFSILPFFRRQGEVWFGYYLNTCFVFITFNILDCIFFGFLANQIAADQVPNFNNLSNYYNSQNSTITYYLILIIAYVSAFRITSYYVGSAEAGRAVSKAVDFVAEMAMIGFTRGGSVAAEGSNTSKIVDGMAKGVKGIKDNEE
jgi:hypothetical protein